MTRSVDRYVGPIRGCVCHLAGESGVGGVIGSRDGEQRQLQLAEAVTDIRLCSLAEASQRRCQAGAGVDRTNSTVPSAGIVGEVTGPRDRTVEPLIEKCLGTHRFDVAGEGFVAVAPIAPGRVSAIPGDAEITIRRSTRSGWSSAVRSAIRPPCE